MPKNLTIYSDGGARGNPGPAAIAFLILDEDKVLKKGSRCLGERTNNQAEYEALLAGLKAAADLGGEEVTCFLDSEVVTRHLTGEYRVRNAELKKLWGRVQVLKGGFRQVKFLNVRRTNRYIVEVDRLVNEALDTECR